MASITDLYSSLEG